VFIDQSSAFLPPEFNALILWYLWSGPRSPLFGKDRIATFERDFIADKTPHREHKNPYFTLINEVEFCDKVLDEFGVDPKRGLIVNGHVPVKIEKGESPLKHSGKAITPSTARSPKPTVTMATRWCWRRIVPTWHCIINLTPSKRPSAMA
jgi:fructose-1,6-bisphosphatase